MNWIGRRAFQFHDTEVSSIVDHSCHALAIDEHRMEFEAAVWTEPQAPQVSDRRAGVVSRRRTPTSAAAARTRGLSDLALDWMLKRLRKLLPRAEAAACRQLAAPLSPDYRGKLYDAAQLDVLAQPLAPADAADQPLRRSGAPGAAACRRSARTPGRSARWCTGARWRGGRRPRPAGAGERYQPRNLLAALEERAGERHARRRRRRRADLALPASMRATDAQPPRSLKPPPLRGTCRQRRDGAKGRPGWRERGKRGEVAGASGLPPAPAWAGTGPPAIGMISGRA